MPVALALPTGRSPVVAALHRSGKYSIGDVEVGALTRPGSRHDANFAAADYGHAAPPLRDAGAIPTSGGTTSPGFAATSPGTALTLTGVAVDIALGVGRTDSGRRKREGQDAVQPRRPRRVTPTAVTPGVPGGGWHLTRADSVGFERWAWPDDAHAHGARRLPEERSGQRQGQRQALRRDDHRGVQPLPRPVRRLGRRRDAIPPRRQARTQRRIHPGRRDEPASA